MFIVSWLSSYESIGLPAALYMNTYVTNKSLIWFDFNVEDLKSTLQPHESIFNIRIRSNFFILYFISVLFILLSFILLLLYDSRWRTSTPVLK